MPERSNLDIVRNLINADPGEDFAGYATTSREGVEHLIAHGQLPQERECIKSKMLPIAPEVGQEAHERRFVVNQPPCVLLTKPVLSDLFRRNGINFSASKEYDPLKSARILAGHFAIRHRLNSHYGQEIGSPPPSRDSIPDSLSYDLIDECEIEGAGVILSLRNHVAELVEPPLTRMLRVKSTDSAIVLSESIEPDWAVLPHFQSLGLPLKEGVRLGLEDFSSMAALGRGDREFLKNLGV